MQSQKEWGVVVLGVVSRIRDSGLRIVGVATPSGVAGTIEACY